MKRFPYQMMFVSFNSNTTDIVCGGGTASSSGAPEFTPVFSGVRVALSNFVCNVLLVPLAIALHCLSSDLCLLITF
jgi:hypothetical protein